MGTKRIEIVPTNWPGIHVDTYQMLSGDSFYEMEVEYLTEEMRVVDSDDWDERVHYFDFDHAAIVADFAAMSWDYVSSNLLEGFIVDSGRIDSASPREYNFTSDSYSVEVEVDVEALEAATPGFDLERYVEEHWQSRDGFFSFVPSRCERVDWDPRSEIGLQMRLESVVREALEDGSLVEYYNLHLWEYEHEVYSDHCTLSPALQALVDQQRG